MKIIYQDLLRFLKDRPSKELISEKLFQLGHENELNGDLFEMDLTPNRGDCLSLLGLARDLNAFFEAQLEVELFKEDFEPLNINFQNLSPNSCPKISFLEIEISDTVANYEDYLESYFKNLGINKNNFFTDISNYLSYELGQPTHCFDANSIDGSLYFEEKIVHEKLQTLLGTEIMLEGNNCVFSDDTEIISLAGVMGGKKTACTKDTKKVLIECAFFEPESIIGKSIKYNLQSEAAHKFERFVDINIQEIVLRRFVRIVERHTEIKSIKFYSYEHKKMSSKKFKFDVKEINSILGTEISSNEYQTILKKLGFQIESEVIIPSHRNDILSQNDLAEEVARVIGYDNIPTKNFEVPKLDNPKNVSLVKPIRSFLKNNGFNEVINFPFSSNEVENAIFVDNPLDSNKEYLRTNLEESLLENLLYNERRQKDSVKLFELSDIYSLDDGINQELRLGIIASGRVGHDYNSFSQKIDNDFLTNVMKRIFNEERITIREIQRKGLDTKIRNNIYYLETVIDASLINENYSFEESNHNTEFVFNKYVKISEYPSSIRDFSFSIKDISKYHEVMGHLENLKDNNLKESFIFDFYKNHKKSEIKLGVRMVFQSKEKTLSEKEIQSSVDKILDPILSLNGVSIPGL